MRGLHPETRSAAVKLTAAERAALDAWRWGHLDAAALLAALGARRYGVLTRAVADRARLVVDYRAGGGGR